MSLKSSSSRYLDLYKAPNCKNKVTIETNYKIADYYLEAIKVENLLY